MSLCNTNIKYVCTQNHPLQERLVWRIIFRAVRPNGRCVGGEVTCAGSRVLAHPGAAAFLFFIQSIAQPAPLYKPFSPKIADMPSRDRGYGSPQSVIHFCGETGRPGGRPLRTVYRQNFVGGGVLDAPPSCVLQVARRMTGGGEGLCRTGSFLELAGGNLGKRLMDSENFPCYTRLSGSLLLTKTGE